MEPYSLKDMSKHIDNLKHDIHPEATAYLTGTEDPTEHRYLTMETLKKFRVGVGSENFFDELEDEWVSLDCVYFPMFMPLNDKQAASKDK